jgi:preprotein translocase subunit SecB
VITSPVHLKNYFVTKLLVKANELADPAQLQNTGASLNTKLETAKNIHDDRQWKVALHISCCPAEKKFAPYYIEAELVGFFEADKTIPEDKIADLMTANAPAILYSAARELILLITGRGPFPPFSLPSATFIDETPSSKKAVAASKPEPVLQH